MPSRRRLLAGLAGGAVVGSVLGTRVSLGSITSWTPAPDSWPLRRFDPANTASNLAVSAPVDPSPVWRESVLARSNGNTLVVGPDRVYAGSDGGPAPPNRAVVALDRADGAVQWSAGVGAGSLALFDGRLYAGPADDRGRIETYDTATGEQIRGADTSGIGERGHLVPTPDGVFLGTGNVLTGRDHDGAARWRHASHGQGVPAIADGHLFAVGYDAVRYDHRRLSDVPTGGRPDEAWRTVYDALLTSLSPAIVGDTLLAPGAVPTASLDSDAEEQPAPLVGIDTETGAVDWRAFADGAREPRAGSDSEDTGLSGVVRTTALATDGQRVYAGIKSGEQSTRRHAVGSVFVDAGDESFRLPSDDWIADLAVVGKPDSAGGKGSAAAGSVLLVATAGDWGNDEPTRAGTISAIDTRRGTELWRVGVPSAIRAIAPVADAVFAVLLDGSVVKLADRTQK